MCSSDLTQDRGHDHVHMRVVGERGAPRVQHRHEADASAEMPGRGRDLECGLGRGFEQQVVDHRLVLIGDVGDKTNTATAAETYLDIEK